MDWNRRIDGYCERVGPEFWAEPWNAITNGAFILAAIIVLLLALRARRLDGPVALLTALTLAIGTGSFLFHTYATAWSAMADVAPIALFILSYFGICMARFGGFPTGRSAGLVVVFLVVLVATSTLLRYGAATPGMIWQALTGTDAETYARNAAIAVVGVLAAYGAVRIISAALVGADTVRGTVIFVIWAAAVMALAELGRAAVPGLFPGMQSYLPALLALLVIGAWLWSRGHPAGNWLLAVTAIFTLSLTLRAADQPYCDHVHIGTHFLWHILNGVVLGALTLAVVRHGQRA